MMKSDTKAIAFNIAEVNLMRAPHRVPSQLNTFTDEGRAIMIVATMKVMPKAGFIPEAYMWWPQTMKPSPAIADME